MEIKVESQRLKELERAEAKLSALEAGGVGYWENYDNSLSEYWDEIEREDKIDQLLDGLEEVFCDKAFIFGEEMRAPAIALFYRMGVTFNPEKEVR